MFTWNIEGLRRNIFNLAHFLKTYSPDMVFLSEPQVFECDIIPIMSHLVKEYCYKLNSQDIHVPDLPLQQSKAHGGTLVMWKRGLHPFISVRPLTSS